MKFLILCTVSLFLALSPIDASENWQRVYFATYPRSGNTWTICLVQKATGVACFRNLNYRNQLLPFEGGGFYAPEQLKHYRLPSEDDVVMIKTHFPAMAGPQTPRYPLIKVLRMVRNPFDSIASYYEFQCKRNGIKARRLIPSDFVKKSILNFKKFQDFYDKHPKVGTFRYEDMLIAPKATLLEMLNFVGYKNISPEDLENAFTFFPPKGKPYKHLNRFHSHDLKLIETQLKDFLETYDYAIPAPF